MPFDTQATAVFVNPVTGRTFQGEKNVAALAAAGLGFHWATFVQWKSAGRSVRKGEKSTLLHGRTFSFRVFEESQTQLVDALPTDVAAIVAPVQVQPVDRDTLALSAWYIGDVVRKLYWSGHADALDRDMASKADAIMATAQAKRAEREALRLSAGALAAYVRSLVEPVKAKAFRQRAAKRAKVEAPFTGSWATHPVSGYRIRLPVGVTLATVCPDYADAAFLKAARAEFAKCGRVGLSNTLAWLETTGRKTDASNYRKRAAERRREHGRISYHYGPVPMDKTTVLEAVTYADDGRELRADGF